MNITDFKKKKFQLKSIYVKISFSFTYGKNCKHKKILHINIYQYETYNEKWTFNIVI